MHSPSRRMRMGGAFGFQLPPQIQIETDIGAVCPLLMDFNGNDIGPTTRLVGLILVSKNVVSLVLSMPTRPGYYSRSFLQACYCETLLDCLSKQRHHHHATDRP